MGVEATGDKINIALDSNEKDVGNAKVEIYKLKAYQYFNYEKQNNPFFTGVSDELVDFDEQYKLSDCALGKNNKIQIDRYDADGYDNLYSKFYVVRNNKILKDGIFATKIDAIVKEKPAINVKSKKGLFGEDYAAYKDLNCSHVMLNFVLTGTIYPNEIVDSDGIVHELDAPDESEAYSFISNGTTYYFNKNRIDDLNKKTKQYYELGSEITLGLVSTLTGDEENYPIKMTYAPYATQGTSLMGQNTSNKWGFEYYVACLEFLNYQHTINDFENGYIATYVLNNEIDFSDTYFRINEEKQPALETYAEENSRLMRLANLASKKYYEGTTIAIPFTHNWGKSEKSTGYAPLELIEWFNQRSKTQGDYDWGIAPHCYGQSLPQVNLYENDTFPDHTTGGKLFGLSGYPTKTEEHEATSMLTFSNLEVLDLYLNQDYLKCDGKVRSVYLTESGVSSFEVASENTEGQRRTQAACIALSYYKVSQLDSVVSYNYYRLIDHSDETANGAYFGLIDESNHKKQSYDVWKYIDTQYSEKVANKYIGDISYYDMNNNLHKKGEVASYFEMLNLFDSDFDFSTFDWDKATPESAKCDEVLEFEDKIDLGDITFEDTDFLYDGQEHSLTISGTLNEGIEVEYENNTITDFGSHETTATFTKDGEVVGKRKATISVKHVISNKTTYNLNEKIFVTTSKCDPNYVLGSGNNSSWVAIYKADAIIGPDPSRYWYYDNVNADSYSRTKCVQEGVDNYQGGLPVGKYKIVYFKDAGYNYDPVDVTYVEIINGQAASDYIDLSNVSFSDTQVKYSGTATTLTISGTLPDGVTVRYENNSLDGEGTTNAIAIFEKDENEIERRYAVLTVWTEETKQLSLNKETYKVGEDILFTAYGESGYWVGLYLKSDVVGPTSQEGTVVSIYWCYVSDDTHVSGGTYNIKEQDNNNKMRADKEVYELPAGEYKMVLFDNTGNGYHIAAEVFFVIEENS